MSIDHLRVLTFCVYLAGWTVLGIGAIVGAIPRRAGRGTEPPSISLSSIFGMLLQGTSALPISVTLADGPLRPNALELVGALVFTPLAAILFVWALRSARHSKAGTLITNGAYACIRHPIYAAFFAMLLATGLLASARIGLAVAIALYVAGSELRIGSEENELAQTFGDDYTAYRKSTRWRYLPGVR